MTTDRLAALPRTTAGKRMLADLAPVEAWKDSTMRATQESVRASFAQDILAIEREAAEREEMWRSMYLAVARNWAEVLDAADKAEDVQADEAIEALRAQGAHLAQPDWHEVPCCYSLHEIEQRCPRTGHTFWDKDTLAQPAPDALRVACRGCAPHPVHDGSCDEPGVPGAAWMCNCREDLREAIEDEAGDEGLLAQPAPDAPSRDQLAIRMLERQLADCRANLDMALAQVAQPAPVPLRVEPCRVNENGCCVTCGCADHITRGCWRCEGRPDDGTLHGVLLTAPDALRAAARAYLDAQQALVVWDAKHGYVINSERDALSGDVNETEAALRAALGDEP